MLHAMPEMKAAQAMCENAPVAMMGLILAVPCSHWSVCQSEFMRQGQHLKQQR